jgi:uncharacterized damage-inducible protein DinB
MRKLGLTLALFAAVALAQNALSTDAKTTWGMVKNNVLRAAEKMPEENWSFKPVPEVRTYGQIVAHIADAQFMMCSAALEEKREPVRVEKTKTTKAEIVAALQDSIKYCDGAFDALTDAKGAEVVKMFGRERPRLGVLSFNSLHSYEHYGNLVTYLRMKGIVPPSSEPRK